MKKLLFVLLLCTTSTIGICQKSYTKKKYLTRYYPIWVDKADDHLSVEMLKNKTFLLKKKGFKNCFITKLQVDSIVKAYGFSPIKYY